MARASEELVRETHHARHFAMLAAQVTNLTVFRLGGVTSWRLGDIVGVEMTESCSAGTVGGHRVDVDMVN